MLVRSISSFHLDPAKTALVIIDLQKGIVATPVVPHSASEIIQKSSMLANHFRAKGATVVYVRVDMADTLKLPVDAPSRDPNAPPPPAAASDSYPKLAFSLKGQARTAHKKTCSSPSAIGAPSAGTGLEQALKQRGVDTVVLTGISTNAGVESTAHQGTGLGFAFVLVEDACGARDAEEHRFAFEKISPRLSRVRKTDEVIAALG